MEPESPLAHYYMGGMRGRQLGHSIEEGPSSGNIFSTQYQNDRGIDQRAIFAPEDDARHVTRHRSRRQARPIDNEREHNRPAGNLRQWLQYNRSRRQRSRGTWGMLQEVGEPHDDGLQSNIPRYHEQPAPLVPAGVDDGPATGSDGSDGITSWMIRCRQANAGNHPTPTSTTGSVSSIPSEELMEMVRQIEEQSPLRRGQRLGEWSTLSNIPSDLLPQRNTSIEACPCSNLQPSAPLQAFGLEQG